MSSTCRRSFVTRALRTALAAGCAALLTAFLPGASRAGAFVPGTSQDYTVGTGPRAIAVGDLNEDGRPDMIVGHEGSNGVSVLLGLAGGGFAPAVTYATGDTPGEVVIADLDGDGHLDFAVGHYDTNDIVIMRGDGTGAFTFGATLDGPPHPEGLVAADLNGDGMLDLASCGYWSYYDGMASVWLNTGTAGGALSFGTRTDYAVGAWPNSIRVGHFTNGSAGLVTANYNASSVTLLESDGAGNFSTRTDLPVPEHVYMAAVGDLFPALDRSQIVTANADTSTVTVYFWLSDSLGWVRHDYATGNRPTYVAIADADGDGALDVVTSDYVAGELSVFSSDQTHGRLRPRVAVPTVAHTYATAVADFDLDGKPDLVASDRQGNTVRVTRGAPKQGWAVLDTLPVFTAPNQNGDLMRIGPGSGKWELIDLCSVWCGPCNEMAKHTENAFLTWAFQPGVKFDYLTMLVDGPTPGTPSTLKNAYTWAKKYKITRPVLHSNGSPDSNTYAVEQASEMWSTPTLRLVDPNGVIRWLSVGAVEETTLVRVIANCMGVAVPPLFAPTSVSVLSATETVSFGSDVASSPMDSQYGPGVFPFNLPEGTFGYDFYSSLANGRDPYTGQETWAVNFLRWDWSLSQVGTLATDQSWQFTVSGLTFDPAVPAFPASGNALLDVTLGDGSQTTSPAPVPFTWNGSTLAFGAVTPAMLAAYPEVTGLTLRVVFASGDPIAGVGSDSRAVFAMHAPAPNPAMRATRLAWTQPRAGETRVEVFDLSGRLVRTVARGALPAGEHSERWDLTDADGSPVRAGLYFARVSVAGVGVRTTRVTVMR